MYIKDSILYNCLIVETAVKIITEFNPEHFKLHDMSAMPRFVLIRNIHKDADIYDKKNQKDVCSVKLINMERERYWIG